MKIRSIAVALLAAFGAVGAQAAVSTSTVGNVTTYTENFDGGTDFSSAWFNTPLGNSDDYLWLSALAPSSSYTFSSAAAIQSIVVEFWYSVSGNNVGTFSLTSGGTSNLGDTPGSALAFVATNPGAGGNANDASFSTTVNNLAAGNYTVTFDNVAGGLTGLKVDDVTITVTAVPEPETYAMLLAGLGVIGTMARRRAKAASAAVAAA